MKRKICIFTGTRADYGLLKPLISRVKNDPQLELQLVASGMHLSKEFGLTYREIENDGFIINEKVNIQLDSDKPVGISKSMGVAMIGLAQAYKKLKPDMVVGMGDRFELLSAVAAALVSRIPVAHISGGDVTEGVIDDSFRHAITKMSHLHFTATESSRRRVIQLGESPEQVFKVGEIGLDNIKEGLLAKEKLEKELRFKFKKHNILVTFHPVTLESDTSHLYFGNLLEVLGAFNEMGIIFTKANADAGGRAINKMIDRYVAKRAASSAVYVSLGRLNYLSAIQFVDAVVGNSSSGLVEAPSFKTGTINIGDRQKGREKASSVIDCDVGKESIENAFKRLYSPNFKRGLKNTKNPFGDGHSSERIVGILKKIDLKNLIRKRFYDLRVEL